MVNRTVNDIPVSEARRIRKAVAKPVTAPVTHTDRDFDEMHARLEALAKRDRDANRRVKIHLLFVTSGILITVALSFVPIPPAVHFGPIAAGLPAAFQEIIDWVRGW